MSVTQDIVLDRPKPYRPKREAPRLRLSIGAALRRSRRRLQQRVAGQLWLHRAAAWTGVVGAVLTQACLFSVVARFMVGSDITVVPGLATCGYGLAAGAVMLALRPLAEAAVTSR